MSATIDSQLVSWTNEYAGPGIAINLPSSVGIQPHEANTSISNDEDPAATPSSINSALPMRASSLSASHGSWVRQAYYDSASGTTESLTFLNHFGGTNEIPETAAGGPASVIFFRSMIECDLLILVVASALHSHTLLLTMHPEHICLKFSKMHWLTMVSKSL